MLRHIDAECRTAAGRDELRSLCRGTWQPLAVLADVDEFAEAPEWAVDKRGARIPCIALTRRREAQVKLDAYERGAADIIEVPFTPDDIVVRTATAIARARDGAVRPRVHPKVRTAGFEMDLIADGVRLDGTFLRLSPLEHTLLYVFLAHPGETVTREAILANVWGQDSAVTSNVIDRHIRDLRVKLGERWRQPRFIETVPGQGYRFIADGNGALAAAE